MKERPILFSAPMVRAILQGRKTQTRRIAPDAEHGKSRACRYGVIGDRLWVRETWCEAHPLAFQAGRTGQRLLYAGIPGPPKVDYLVAYRADGELLPIYHNDGGGHPFRQRDPVDDLARQHYPRGCEYGWLPSIHMPRRASRITLEITGVRVERLRELSEADAEAEGIERTITDDGWRRYATHAEEAVGLWPCTTPRDSFESLWELINGSESWAANPWVWVIEFKRVKP